MKIKPHVCLYDTVDYYWIDRDKPGTYRVLPNGAAMLLLNLGTPVKLRGNMTIALNYMDFMFVGTHDRYFDIQKQEGSHLVGVRFTQAGGHHLLREHMHFYRNKFSNLINIGNIIKPGLLSKLLRVRDNYLEVEKVLNHFMIVNINSAGRHLPTIRYALSKLHPASAAPSINDICMEVSLSNKYLIELFKSMVGMPPKTIQRINKFTRVLNLVQASEIINWADIANESQFYDQSHLIKDFKALSGDTPKNFIKKDLRKRYYLYDQPFSNGKAINGH